MAGGSSGRWTTPQEVDQIATSRVPALIEREPHIRSQVNAGLRRGERAFLKADTRLSSMSICGVEQPRSFNNNAEQEQPFLVLPRFVRGAVQIRVRVGVESAAPCAAKWTAAVV